MKIEKLDVKVSSLDINLKFYFMLKHIVKSKLTDRQSNDLLEIINLHKNNQINETIERLCNYSTSINSVQKTTELISIIDTMMTKIDLQLFSFVLKLCLIKDLLLQEAKLKEVFRKNELAGLNPLSVAYDNISVYAPYTTRVNGALLSLLFFSKIEAGKINFMSKDACAFMESLAMEAKNLKGNGIEPNQIFMLMFSESINQSIISDSGSNYEDRILSVLHAIGLPNNSIKKAHDKNDKSTEFDFFFELDNKTFGIGAKRTLRERYKQFIKTGQMSQIDVMIEITLGLDLNKSKAETIRSHGVYLFVANEIYDSRTFLQEIEGIYSIKDLSLSTLQSLAN